MKRCLCSILSFVILFTVCQFPGAASVEAVYLPENLMEVQAEAFSGNKEIMTVLIPKSVKSIGSRAFAGCTGLTDVHIGNNPSMEIAPDAFEGCNGVLFHVYPDSSGELFALSHGFRREYVNAGSAAWERTMSMIGDAGFSDSYFNSPQWTTKRLIVRRAVDYLPDISAYNPIQIVEKDYYNIFIIQFDTPEDTKACYSVLHSDPNTVYVEEDIWHELDIIQGAGIVDDSVWYTPDGQTRTDDPMGFDDYAPFVKQNGSGIVKIAIVDSGVKSHAHYNSLLIDGKNMMEDIDGQSWSNDPANHGSVIASIIKDCVGDNNVRIIPVRVAGSQSQFDDELLAAGIDYAVDKGADIINLSMSFPRSAVVKDAINHAVESGVTIVVAAGNDDRNVSNVFPANMSDVITVSGIEPGYVKEEKSNWGAVDYCAPARFICTTAYASLHRYTSFAAPMIASAFALVELDDYHSVTDMNESCILANDPSSFGKGLPQLQLLAEINAKGIVLDTELPNKMKVGDSVDFEWTVKPTNATNQTVTVVSSDEDVLQVTGNETGGGILKAIGQGTANITLTVNGSTVSVTSKNILVEQPVTEITIAGAPEKLVVGRSVRLSAQVLPENATTKTYTWHSVNDCVSVDQNGLVTGLSAGTARVYAVADDGYGVESNELTFPVVEQPDAESVNLYVDGVLVNGTTISMEPGDKKILTHSVLPEEAEQVVKYESLDPSVATVDENTGIITAVAPGTTNILAFASTGSNIKAVVTIKVNILPEDLTLSVSQSTVEVGSKVMVNAVISPDNATNKTLIWETSDPSIATVSNGVVTAKSRGSVNITATTSNGIQKAIVITVVQPITVYFNVNGGSCSEASRNMYAGNKIGTLPTPTRTYFTFDGWYTAASDGTKVTDSTVFTANTTLYARWTDNPYSDWVLESSVPSNARIVETKWKYTETTTSTATSMAGWVQTNSKWVQSGNGSFQYASFASGFDTDNDCYKAYNRAPYTSYENTTSKRTVNNSLSHYIYWHWMYDVAPANGFTNRAIYYYNGKSPTSMTGTSRYYEFFEAFETTEDTSTTADTVAGGNGNWGQDDTDYSWFKRYEAGFRSGWWYKTPVYWCSYTDYTKHFSYTRTVEAVSQPTASSSISNIEKWVKYQME